MWTGFILLEMGPVVGCSEPSGFVRGGEFRDQLSDR
jgi:hypothetical protein